MLYRALHRLIRILPDHIALKANVQLSRWNGAVDPEMNQIAAYIPVDRRRVAIDIGANNGVTASVLSSCFKKVFAIEPNPQLLDRWKCVTLPNISAFQLAISNFDGRVALNIPVVNGQPLTGWASIEKPLLQCDFKIISIETECMTLDSFCAKQRIEIVDFIKIDAEGVEKSILAGGVEVLRRSRPWLIIECTEVTRADIVAFLRKLDIYPVVAAELGKKIKTFSNTNVVFRPKP